MIKKQIVYTTTDGKQFENKAVAEQYQRIIGMRERFEKFLDSTFDEHYLEKMQDAGFISALLEYPEDMLEALQEPKKPRKVKIDAESMSA